MDRVKGLRRATAAVVLVVASALVLSCSRDDGGGFGHASGVLNPGDIYGTVTDSSGPVEGATVTWVCYTDNDAYLGSDTTDEEGIYFIDSSTWGSGHDTHTLKGTAVKTGYQNDVQWISDYDHTQNYRKDFYLIPAR